MAKSKKYRWQLENEGIKQSNQARRQARAQAAPVKVSYLPGFKPKATSESKEPPSPDIWWLIPAREKTVCHGCDAKQPTGEGVAYCYGEKKVLCSTCWDKQGLKPRASKAWRNRADLKAAPITRPDRTSKRSKKNKAKPPSAGALARSMKAMKTRNAEPPAIVQPKGTPGAMLKMYELVSLRPLVYKEVSRPGEGN